MSDPHESEPEFTEHDLSEDAGAGGESERYQRWVSASRRPLDVLAMVFLVDLLLIWSFPEARGAWPQLLQGVSWFVWAAFVLDYVVRLSLSSDRGRFVRTHKIDLAMVLLPMLRLLRVAILVSKSLASVSSERIASSIVSIAVIIVVLSAFLVWRVEMDAPGANIHTFRESLWWAVVTVTTVGYGNYVPVTAKGQFIASGLMLVGISLIGTVSASVAAYFVKRPVPEGTAGDDLVDGGDDEAPVPVPAPVSLDDVMARLDALTAEQAQLRALLEKRV